MTQNIDPELALKMATDIVIAYLGQGSVSSAELPALVRQVRSALMDELALSGVAPSQPVALTAQVPLEETITPDWLVCLEDGGRYKSLRRHLRAKYNMTPDEYRRKWNLPADYPMVAPNYSKLRSRLAKDTGFNNNQKSKSGRSRAKPASAA